MHYVYLLKSISFQNQTYTGCTSDLKERLKIHNAGESPYTAKYKPWRLENYFAFSDKYRAFAFEKYLKSSSGKAFTKKHF